MEPEKSILKEFIAGGWVIVVLGTATMFARILVDEEKNTICTSLKKIVSAAILTTVAWAFIRDMAMGDLHKALIYGVVGACVRHVYHSLALLGLHKSKTPLYDCFRTN